MLCNTRTLWVTLMMRKGICLVQFCFFFVSEWRYIKVAVTMKEERTKNAVKDNLKVTKKKLHWLWHILQKSATGHFWGQMYLNTRFYNNTQHTIYKMKKIKYSLKSVHNWDKKTNTKKNTHTQWLCDTDSPCFSYFWVSFSSFKRFFLAQKAESVHVTWMRSSGLNK